MKALWMMLIAGWPGFVALFALALHPSASVQDHKMLSPAMTGTTVQAGGDVWTGPGIARSVGSDPPKEGGSYETSWKHDLDGPGPAQPINIVVRYEQQPGEDAQTAVRKFSAKVRAAAGEFPPNVGPSTP